MPLVLCFGFLSVAQVISESTKGIFNEKLFILGTDLQRSCKDGLQCSHISFPQYSLMLTAYITMVQLSEVRNSHYDDLSCRFYSDFTSFSTYVLFPFLAGLIGVECVVRAELTGLLWDGFCGLATPYPLRPSPTKLYTTQEKDKYPLLPLVPFTGILLPFKGPYSRNFRLLILDVFVFWERTSHPNTRFLVTLIRMSLKPIPAEQIRGRNPPKQTPICPCPQPTHGHEISFFLSHAKNVYSGITSSHRPAYLEIGL